MKLNEYKAKVDDSVIESMISYMEECEEDDDCSYSIEDVEKCKSLMYNYLEELDKMSEPSDEAIMEQVKTLVLALNDLNEKTDCVLIEADQREAICEIIQMSAEDYGLQNCDDDISEEWREW